MAKFVGIPSDLPWNPALFEISCPLGISQHEAMGFLCALWCYTAKYAKGDVIPFLDSSSLPRACGGTKEFWELVAEKTDWIEFLPSGVMVRGEYPKSGNRTSSPGQIYFIFSEETNSVKIGFTRRHPEDRLADIQVGNSSVLTLLGSMAGSHEEEHELHRKFDGYRLSGEWFRYDGEVADFIHASVEGNA